jgi:IclR family acetate operon transcriptional repressor
LSTIKVALRVLQVVARDSGIGVTEIARQLGEPKSTVQRALEALHDDGWISPASTVGWRRWAVTMKMTTLASAIDQVLTLRKHALPIMEELRAGTHETIYLMIAELNEVIILEMLESPQPLRAVLPVGARAPLHVSSAGKAILAHLPKDEQAAYLRHELAAPTATSITDPAALRRELDLTRKRGFGVSKGEFHPDIRAVAAVIFSPTDPDRPLGALSIAGPALRLSDEAIPALGRESLKCANRVSERMRAINSGRSAARPMAHPPEDTPRAPIRRAKSSA